MAERLTAHFENREYFFTVTKQAADELHIDMYKQSYVFFKDKNEWLNRDANKMKMAVGLIQAVTGAVKAQKENG